MQLTSLKRIGSPRGIQMPLVRKIRRLYHIKSLPAHTQQFLRKQSRSKIEVHPKDQPEIKIKRFKTHQHLKAPAKSAREKHIDWCKKKQQQSVPSKSLTKSTTYRSPNNEKESQKKFRKMSKQKSKKSLKKVYSGMLERMKEVVQQYQLRLDRCLLQKEEIVRENNKLKNQLQSYHRKPKKYEK